MKPPKRTLPDNEQLNPKPPKSKYSIPESLNGELPLQSETSLFILINVLDIFVTYCVLRFNGMEANPIANAVFSRFGFQGMIWFKLIIVAGVCVISQIIAQSRLRTAQALLWMGSGLVGAVVIYSLLLLARQIGIR